MSIGTCHRCDKRKELDRLGLCAYCRAYTDIPGDWGAEALRMELAVRVESFDAASREFAAERERLRAALAERDGEIARLWSEREQAFLLLDSYQQERERTGAIPDDDEVDQAIAILRDRETADAAPQPPTCHMCGTPTVLRQDLDRLRVYGCDACDTEYCRRKG